MPVAYGETLPARLAAPLDVVRTSHFSLTELPGRDLDEGELLALVAAIALDDDRWRDLVVRDEAGRHYACLYRDAHVDVWILSWAQTGDTGWHDHDVSCGAVAVVEGCLIEHNLAVAGPHLQTAVSAGHAYSFGPDHIHRLMGRDPASTSIHAYSPPLERLGQYVVASNGVLRRTVVAYTDELRADRQYPPAPPLLHAARRATSGIAATT